MFGFAACEILAVSDRFCYSKAWHDLFSLCASSYSIMTVVLRTTIKDSSAMSYGHARCIFEGK
jgi:hypothetical protein